MKSSYLFLGLTLFVLLNLSKERVDVMRGSLVEFLSPLWQTAAFASKEPMHRKEEVDLLLLRAQLDDVRAVVPEMKRVPSVTPAKVLFRDPSHWSSTIWIDLGEEDAVEKNNPVLLGGSLIGVIEYVGHNQSRVRLITDAGLAAAVRAVRGGIQNRELLNHLELFLQQIQVRSDLFSSEEDQEQFLSLFAPLQKKLAPCKEELLAKGELRGSSAPLWRSASPTLMGIGFNYDVADEAGPARNLHTSSLLKVGDLLVTSGLDGVFPYGIPVAVVSKIHPLKPGDYFYTLEAKPTAGTLQDFNTVFVLSRKKGFQQQHLF